MIPFENSFWNVNEQMSKDRSVNDKGVDSLKTVLEIIKKYMYFL